MSRERGRERAGERESGGGGRGGGERESVRFISLFKFVFLHHLTHTYHVVETTSELP
jgi:hypothetical protein